MSDHDDFNRNLKKVFQERQIVEQRSVSDTISTEIYWNEDKKDKPSVVCPECGDDFVHFEQPHVIKSGNKQGVAWEGKGDLLVVPLWGECGAIFEICFGFHKGNTFSFVNILKSCTE
jgi:hypothetical protein